MLDQTSKNYEFLSKIYDEIMSGVSHESWYKLIINICEEKKLGKSAKILELGGGTGILGKKLKDYGFNYQGSDISFEMAKEAKRKNLDFVCADSRNIPFCDKFNLIIFLFDGINYIFNIEEFTKTFQQAYYGLETGGYFLFDITTEVNSMRNFRNYREAFAAEKFAYIRESYYYESDKEQCNDFEIFIEKKEGIYHRRSEKHRQKIHSTESIIKSIPQDMFTIEGIYGNFSRERYKKDSERIHFLLKKH
ncbi:MAG: class I SAM-dependent methyltransferase [Chitinispirillales bacterium]|jgi:ubiquinone/menaquinone biosynthesis C-methylase UbiE|nr:class I SAM-dependent methyltransferase [Chitinispirillales bacterium]